MNSSNLLETASKLSILLRAKKLRISAAESCTGGMISMILTEIAGSSDIFERGFVTYSNESKIELLNVPAKYIENYGAVSKQVAISMADGALRASHADISVSVTGCAGPSGGSVEKPVGTVFIGCTSQKCSTSYKHFVFEGDRNSIRTQSALAALELAIAMLDV